MEKQHETCEYYAVFFCFSFIDTIAFQLFWPLKIDFLGQILNFYRLGNKVESLLAIFLFLWTTMYMNR